MSAPAKKTTPPRPPKAPPAKFKTKKPMSAAKAKSSTTKKTPDKPRAPRAGSASVKYKLTGNPYRPKAIQNRESWRRVQGILEKKGTATEEELLKALQYGDEFIKSQEGDETWPVKYREAHTDFLGYLSKGKMSKIVEVK